VKRRTAAHAEEELYVTVGEQSWNLEQDFSNRERWLHQPDPDRLRGWS